MIRPWTFAKGLFRRRPSRVLFSAGDICDICARCAINRRKNVIPFKFSTPNHAFEVIAIDEVRLTPTHSGNTGVWVIVDALTGRCILVPTTSSTTAERLCSILFQHVVSKWGFTTRIISDKDITHKTEHEFGLDTHDSRTGRTKESRRHTRTAKICGDLSRRVGCVTSSSRIRVEVEVLPSTLEHSSTRYPSRVWVIRIILLSHI